MYIKKSTDNTNEIIHRMLKQLLNYAKEIKSSLRLSVYQKNTRAIAFYQREQFVIRSVNIDDSTNEKEFIMTWSK